MTVDKFKQRLMNLLDELERSYTAMGCTQQITKANVIEQTVATLKMQSNNPAAYALLRTEQANATIPNQLIEFYFTETTFRETSHPVMSFSQNSRGKNNYNNRPNNYRDNNRFNGNNYNNRRNFNNNFNNRNNNNSDNRNNYNNQNSSNRFGQNQNRNNFSNNNYNRTNRNQQNNNNHNGENNRYNQRNRQNNNNSRCIRVVESENSQAHQSHGDMDAGFK